MSTTFLDDVDTTVDTDPSVIPVKAARLREALAAHGPSATMIHGCRRFDDGVTPVTLQVLWRGRDGADLDAIEADVAALGGQVAHRGSVSMQADFPLVEVPRPVPPKRRRPRKNKNKQQLEGVKR